MFFFSRFPLSLSKTQAIVSRQVESAYKLSLSLASLLFFIDPQPSTGRLAPTLLFGNENSPRFRCRARPEYGSIGTCRPETDESRRFRALKALSSRNFRGRRRRGGCACAEAGRRGYKRLEFRLAFLLAALNEIDVFLRCRRRPRPLFFSSLSFLFSHTPSIPPALYRLQAQLDTATARHRREDARCSGRIGSFRDSTSNTTAAAAASTPPHVTHPARHHHPHRPAPRRPLLCREAHPPRLVDGHLVRSGVLRGQHGLPLLWGPGHQRRHCRGAERRRVRGRVGACVCEPGGDQELEAEAAERLQDWGSLRVYHGRVQAGRVGNELGWLVVLRREKGREEKPNEKSEESKQRTTTLLYKLARIPTCKMTLPCREHDQEF